MEPYCKVLPGIYTPSLKNSNTVIIYSPLFYSKPLNAIKYYIIKVVNITHMIYCPPSFMKPCRCLWEYIKLIKKNMKMSSFIHPYVPEILLELTSRLTFFCRKQKKIFWIISHYSQWFIIWFNSMIDSKFLTQSCSMASVHIVKFRGL